MPITNPPFTKVVSSHGLSIFVNGNVVGSIHQYEIGHSRDATHTYEFGGVTEVPLASGEPFDIVPGNAKGLDIKIGRYDIYTSRFERAFGTQDLTMLTSQTLPIELRQFMASPDGTLNESFRVESVWWTRLGRRFSASDNRIVMVDASAVYRVLRRIG